CGRGSRTATASMARRSQVRALDDGVALPALRFDAPARDHDGPDGQEDDARLAPSYVSPRDGWFRRVRPALLLALLCAGLIATTWLAWTPALEGVSEGASALAAREGDGQTQVTVTVALAALALLGFVLAWARGTHPRRAV